MIHAFTAFLDRSSSVLLGLTVTLLSAQVFLRVVFNEPQAWAEEVGRYLFVWMVYLGATVATVRESHIRVTFLIERLGPWAETFSIWLGRLVNLFCFSFVAWFAWQIAWKKRNAEFYTIPDLPQVIFYLSVPVCLTMMTLFLIYLIGSRLVRR